jgi:hypothetical protein
MLAFLLFSSLAAAEPITCQALQEWLETDLAVPVILDAIVQEGVPPAEMACIRAAKLPSTVVYAASVSPLGARYAPPKAVVAEPDEIAAPDDEDRFEDRYDDDEPAPSLARRPRARGKGSAGSGKGAMVAGGLLLATSNVLLLAASSELDSTDSLEELQKKMDKRAATARTAYVIGGAGGVVLTIGAVW